MDSLCTIDTHVYQFTYVIFQNIDSLSYCLVSHYIRDDLVPSRQALDLSTATGQMSSRQTGSAHVCSRSCTISHVYLLLRCREASYDEFMGESEDNVQQEGGALNAIGVRTLARRYFSTRCCTSTCIVVDPAICRRVPKSVQALNASWRRAWKTDRSPPFLFSKMITGAFCEDLLSVSTLLMKFRADLRKKKCLFWVDGYWLDCVKYFNDAVHEKMSQR